MKIRWDFDGHANHQGIFLAALSRWVSLLMLCSRPKGFPKANTCGRASRSPMQHDGTTPGAPVLWLSFKICQQALGHTRTVFQPPTPNSQLQTPNSNSKLQPSSNPTWTQLQPNSNPTPTHQHANAFINYLYACYQVCIYIYTHTHVPTISGILTDLRCPKTNGLLSRLQHLGSATLQRLHERRQHLGLGPVG